MEYPNVKTVQVIFNMFRQRPMDLFFGEAQRRQVGVLARVPLSSGMLTGKMTRESTFQSDDHRHFNRQGAGFDRGETFSGLDYETGLQAVDELRALVPAGMTKAQKAQRRILMSPAVTCAIPGAKRPSQVEENISAADLPALSDETMSNVRGIYERLVRPQVHHYW
jgi:aryl-alcohol dehydrogenase-like predicted oxidoreductase